MQTKSIFYRCGICECLHPWNWNGDCRDDANRFAADELDSKFGPFGWDEETMENRIAADEASEQDRESYSDTQDRDSYSVEN